MARKLNNFITEFMDWTSNVETAEKFLKWSVISLVSASLERRTWCKHPQNNLIFYPNQYIFLVGNSGVARKSTAAQHVIDLAHTSGIKLLPDRVTGASLFDALQLIGTEKSYKFEGKEYPMSAGFLYGSEAAQSFHQDENSAIIALTDLYDCGKTKGWSTEVSNEESTRTAGRKRVFNPCLNMLMCTTSTWLRSKIVKEDVKGGFTGRILFVTHMGAAERVISWNKALDPQRKNHYEQREQLKHDLGEMLKLSGQFRFADDFGALYDEEAKNIRAFVEANPNHMLDGYYGRKLSHFMKLSMVASAAAGDSLIITAAHFKQAQEWLSEIEPDMLAAFVDSQNLEYANSEDQLAAVCRYLDNKARIDKVSLMKFLILRMGMGNAPRIMNALLEIGIITRSKAVSTNIVYDVHKIVL